MDKLEAMGGGFAIFPRIVMEEWRLSPSAKLVYMKLIDFAYNKLYCYPTQETIGDRLNLSGRRVRDLLKELAEFGLIKIWRNEEGIRNINHYIVVPLEDVKNLWGEYEKVPETQWRVSKEEFDKLVHKSQEFYETKEHKKPRTNRVSSLERAKKKIDAGDWDKMIATDFVCYFIIRFKEIYKKEYAGINWGRDASTLKKTYLDEGFKGLALKQLIDFYIETYDTHFKRTDFPEPVISYLKVHWIKEKLFKLILEEAERREVDSQNDGAEVVGTF